MTMKDTVKYGKFWVLKMIYAHARTLLIALYIQEKFRCMLSFG